jgi:hypothetical protein
MGLVEIGADPASTTTRQTFRNSGQDRLYLYAALLFSFSREIGIPIVGPTSNSYHKFCRIPKFIPTVTHYSGLSRRFSSCGANLIPSRSLIIHVTWHVRVYCSQGFWKSGFAVLYVRPDVFRLSFQHCILALFRSPQVIVKCDS